MDPLALCAALKSFVGANRPLTLLEIRSLLILPAPNARERVGIKEVAGTLSTGRASISRTITALVGEGLVTREEDTDDRRLKMLARSPSGERIVKRALRRIYNAP